MELDRVAHHLRDEDVVLELLDAGVQDRGGQRSRQADGEADEDGGDGRHDRPDDREPFEHAGDERQDQRELPELTEAGEGERGEADDGGQEDREPQEQLPADPSAADAPEQPEQVLGVGAPRRGHRAGDGSAEPLAVLEDEEQPHRHDDEAEQEGGRAHDGVDGGRHQAAQQAADRLAGIDQLRVDHGAKLRRQREPFVPADQPILDLG
jgi:hypothetical protein